MNADEKGQGRLEPEGLPFRREGGEVRHRRIKAGMTEPRVGGSPRLGGGDTGKASRAEDGPGDGGVRRGGPRQWSLARSVPSCVAQRLLGFGHCGPGRRRIVRQGGGGRWGERKSRRRSCGKGWQPQPSVFCLATRIPAAAFLQKLLAWERPMSGQTTSKGQGNSGKHMVSSQFSHLLANRRFSLRAYLGIHLFPTTSLPGLIGDRKAYSLTAEQGTPAL